MLAVRLGPVGSNVVTRPSHRSGLEMTDQWEIMTKRCRLFQPLAVPVYTLPSLHLPSYPPAIFPSIHHPPSMPPPVVGSAGMKNKSPCLEGVHRVNSKARIWKFFTVIHCESGRFFTVISHWGSTEPLPKGILGNKVCIQKVNLYVGNSHKGHCLRQFLPIEIPCDPHI